MTEAFDTPVGDRAPIGSPVTVEVAWLDQTGCIVAANEAWRAFAATTGGDPGRCGVGASYLEVCATAGDEASARLAHAIGDALTGAAAVPAHVTAPQETPTGSELYDLVVYPRWDGDGRSRGAVVARWPVSVHPSPLRPGAERPPGSLLDEAWPILEDLPDGALLVAGDGTIAYANHTLLRLSGYEPSELVGQPVEMLVPPGQRGRHAALQEHYRASPHARMMGEDLILSLQPKQGDPVPVEISLAPFSSAGLVSVIAVVRDVSVQRAADRERARLLGLLDLDPDAVLVIDADDGSIQYANSGASTLLGYTADELQSMRVTDISPTSTNELRRRFVDEHRRGGPGYHHEVEIVRTAKDGTSIPCDSRGQLVADGERAVFIVVDRDARPRLAAERQRERRAALVTLVAQVTTMVLSDVGADEVYQAVVEGAAEVLEAGNASLILREASTGELVTVATVGPGAELHRDGRAQLDEQVLRTMLEGAEAFSLAAPDPKHPAEVRALAGPGVVAPLPASDGTRGLLSVFRQPGDMAFTDEEVTLLGDLARHVVTVIELGRARAEEQRLLVLEDRQRIARDLHDNVIQDLIGLGMQLAAGPRQRDEAAERERNEQLVDTLEAAVRKLRMIVFDARQTQPPHLVTKALASTVAEASRILGHHPLLSVEGPVDALPPVVTSQLFPALREALSNVARHAGATRTSVTIEVSEERLVLVVEDNGRGPGLGAAAGMGLSNLRERAATLGGASSLRSRAGGGSCLEWWVRLPLPPADTGLLREGEDGGGVDG